VNLLKLGRWKAVEGGEGRAKADAQAHRLPPSSTALDRP